MLYATMVLPTVRVNGCPLCRLPAGDSFWKPIGRPISTAGGWAWLCVWSGAPDRGLSASGWSASHAPICSSRRPTLEACARGAAALAIAGLIAMPWYLAMEVRNPGYLHYYFVERHLLGFATQSQRHGGEPWWYYLPIILSGGLPWILYLPVAVRDWWERRKGESCFPDDGGTTLLWCWFLACTVLLSAAGSKLVTYIWPVFPPVAVLAAAVWTRLFDGALSAPATKWFGLCFAPIGWIGPLLLPLSLPILNRVLGLPVPWYAVVLAVLVGLSAWIPSWLWSRRRLSQALPAGVLVPAAHMLFVLAFVLPHLATQQTPETWPSISTAAGGFQRGRSRRAPRGLGRILSKARTAQATRDRPVSRRARRRAPAGASPQADTVYVVDEEHVGEVARRLAPPAAAGWAALRLRAG